MLEVLINTEPEIHLGRYKVGMMIYRFIQYFNLKTAVPRVNKYTEIPGNKDFTMSFIVTCYRLVAAYQGAPFADIFWLNLRMNK